jgi:hypothetical protein
MPNSSFGRRTDSAGSGPRGFSSEQLATIARHELAHDYKNGVRDLTDAEKASIGSLKFAYAKARNGNASWEFLRAATERIGKYNKVHDPLARIDVWEHWPKSVADIDAIILWRQRSPR